MAPPGEEEAGLAGDVPSGAVPSAFVMGVSVGVVVLGAVASPPSAEADAVPTLAVVDMARVLGGGVVGIEDG